MVIQKMLYRALDKFKFNAVYIVSKCENSNFVTNVLCITDFQVDFNCNHTHVPALQTNMEAPLV